MFLPSSLPFFYSHLQLNSCEEVPMCDPFLSSELHSCQPAGPTTPGRAQSETSDLCIRPSGPCQSPFPWPANPVPPCAKTILSLAFQNIPFCSLLQTSPSLFLTFLQFQGPSLELFSLSVISPLVILSSSSLYLLT